MDKKEIAKILSKIKDTVGENNYKLALAITGHRTGKIKDIIMCSKDGELLLEYVEQLEQQCKKQKEVIDKAKSLNYEISHIIYEDFLEENIMGSKFLYERIKKQLSILEDKEVSE